jgi:hypothetical protein
MPEVGRDVGGKAVSFARALSGTVLSDCVALVGIF